MEKITFEIDVDKAKELIKELEEHMQEYSTTIIFDLECNKDEWDKTYDVIRFNVEYGGEKAH